MRIRTTVVAAGTAGALGLAGLGVGLGAAPAAVAAGAEDTVDETVGRGADRVQRITEALAGLVEDGTITQQQADEVADTLAEDGVLGRHGHGGPPGAGGLGGPGGFGAALDVAADSLGISVADLRRAVLQDGATLADLAAANDVEVGDLVDDLVAAATERVQQGVDDGRIDQQRADEIVAALPERVEAAVRAELPGVGRHGHGHGPGGWHGRGGPGVTDGETDGETGAETDGATGGEQSSLGT